jgi:tetratricopeptide (TPR) repeat protein
MATSTENFKYQESAEKNKIFKLRDSNRKRLFANDNSSDDEVDHIEKKVKIVMQRVDGPMIFRSYQAKEYEKCLQMIDEILKQSKTEIEDPLMTQYKIIQAACWTMLEVHKEKIKSQLMEIITKDPKNSFAHYGYGLYQYHEGNMSVSIESFAKAIDLNPSGAMKKALELKAKAKSFMDMLCDGELI